MQDYPKGFEKKEQGAGDFIVTCPCCGEDVTDCLDGDCVCHRCSAIWNVDFPDRIIFLEAPCEYCGEMFECRNLKLGACSECLATRQFYTTKEPIEDIPNRFEEKDLPELLSELAIRYPLMFFVGYRTEGHKGDDYEVPFFYRGPVPAIKGLVEDAISKIESKDIDGNKGRW
jgi:hypothetical protein